MHRRLVLFALLVSCAAALPVPPAVAADCKIFYTGQCPGDDSCLCTLNEPCSSSSEPCIRNASTSNCGGACRKVAHGLCPGGTSCLADTGDCDAPPPPPSYAWGPDVSDYQGSVDWAAVKAAGASFAFTKATEGVTFTCDTFAPNWQGMRDAGIGFRCVAFQFWTLILRPADAHHCPPEALITSATPVRTRVPKPSTSSTLSARSAAARSWCLTSK